MRPNGLDGRSYPFECLPALHAEHRVLRESRLGNPDTGGIAFRTGHRSSPFLSASYHTAHMRQRIFAFLCNAAYDLRDIVVAVKVAIAISEVENEQKFDCELP